jgi:hypothetical protein
MNKLYILLVLPIRSSSARAAHDHGTSPKSSSARTNWMISEAAASFEVLM